MTDCYKYEYENRYKSDILNKYYNDTFVHIFGMFISNYWYASFRINLFCNHVRMNSIL